MILPNKFTRIILVLFRRMCYNCFAEKDCGRIAVISMLQKIRDKDDIFIERVAKLHTPFLNHLMRFLTFLGDQGKIWFVVLAIIIYSKRSVYVAVSFFGSVIFAFVSSEVIIKRIVARVRPCHKIDEENLVLKKIPKFYSFPSSHSATSFAMVTLSFVHCSMWTTIAILILAIGISFSRFYLQAHYLTDVVCGIIIGVTFSYAMSRVILAIFTAYYPSLI